MRWRRGMKREHRQKLTRRELAAITSGRPVVRKLRFAKQTEPGLTECLGAYTNEGRSS